MRSRFICHLLGVLIASCGLAGAAHAALGEGPGSAEADAAALRGALQVETRQGHEVYDILGSENTRVREYVNEAGLVFAVSWSGPAPPDLARWLGRYFAEYAQALATLAHRGLRRSLRVETTGGLMVEAGGHLRAYSGRAYLVQQMPPGVAPGDLR